MLLGLLAVTLVLLALGIALPKATVLPPAFWAHLILAVGVMSLITAAMQHFTPVLTRGRLASGRVAMLPWLMLGAGILASIVLAGLLNWRLLTLAAVLALASTVVMLGWMGRRARHTLGRPHPGLTWYFGALVCLALGLGAAAAIPWLPQWHAELRAFHLHINLYGFIGLTAIGTLQVLMPTVVNRADPGAAQRLRRDFAWVCAGALLLAIGTALLRPPIVWVGIALWCWPLARLADAWLRLYSREIFTLHGQAPVLMAAVIGFICALFAIALAPPTLGGPLGILLPGFLFPLVSGAAGQLAPVWADSQGRRAAQLPGQLRLARYGGARAALFLCAALLPLLGFRCGGMVGLIGLGWFLLLFFWWGLRDASA
ncbi:MAG: hypothetical protein ACFCUG_14645 [Thiotrichales bacterium]